METFGEKIHQHHAICIPYPSQSHIKSLLKFAKLLHITANFHITFVNTEFNHRRFLRSRGRKALNGLPGFAFETIPDGLPPSDADCTQDIPALCKSIETNCLAPFLDIIMNKKVKTGAVTCIISDGFMSSFTVEAAKQIGIPVVLFWPISAASFMGFYQFHNLSQKGLTPLKDTSFLTNGYLDTIIDWIPGMKNIRLRDLPSPFKTTDPNDILLNFTMKSAQRNCEATASVFQTFDALEPDLLHAFSTMFTNVYAIGPLQPLLNQKDKTNNLGQIGYNLWKEEPECLQWLDSKADYSVIYVNFGSITVISRRHLVEFAWGLANSQYHFLWIIRPDLVIGDTKILPFEIENVIRERGFIASWCGQEEVLNHPSIGGFLTHCGWNSIIESLSSGVPMLCWPFFGDQPTNCAFMCNEWEIGIEIENPVKRDEVEKLVRELMDGERGDFLKKNVKKWKRRIEEASGSKGSSSMNLDKLVMQINVATTKN